MKAYKNERNKLNKMLFAAKKQEISDKVIKCGKDTKKLYSLVNKLTGTKKSNPMPEGKSDAQLAEDFADFFIEKIMNIRQSLADKTLYNPTDRVDGELSQFQPLTENDVRKLINEMASKSCELDPVPTTILKQCLDKCICIITKIINVSLKKGVFVRSWKTAIVRPILKKLGLELIKSNYRPVSNLSFLSKLLEKAALQQFNPHCDEHNYFPDYQSAYRTSFSCETALVKICDDILWNMEKGLTTALRAIDLSAAFDTVDHNVLLKVLDMKFGIRGTCLEWCDSYLRPRDMKVCVNGSYSAIRNLDFSVPQGSCAGPTFYSVYASTMKECISKELHLHGYADDHALKLAFKAGSSLNQDELKAITLIEHNLIGTKTWMDENRLKMNDAKTEFILFGTWQQLNKCVTNHLTANECEVPRSEVIKYLGCDMDERLSFKHHIKRKCRVAMANLMKILNIRKYLTESACVQVILGLVISHLDYANALFGGLPKQDIAKLQRVQNSAAKIVLRKERRDSATSCLKQLHWLPIRLRITYKILTLTHKCLYGEAPPYLKEMLHLKSAPTRSLRSGSSNKMMLEVPFVKKQTLAARSFSVQAPQAWNDLPMELRLIDSFDLFKAKLKTHLFAQF